MDNGKRAMMVAPNDACIAEGYQLSREYYGRESTSSFFGSRMLSRTQPLLVVTLLLSANWVLAEAVSFSSSSRSSPSFAPTSLVANERATKPERSRGGSISHHRPSSSPISPSRPHPKSTKKHKKEKTEHGMASRAISDVGIASKNRKKNEKRKKTKALVSQAPAAFGLKKQVKRNPNSSRTTSAGEFKHDRERSRIRPSSKATKKTAFIRDHSIRNRKEKTINCREKNMPTRASNKKGKKEKNSNEKNSKTPKRKTTIHSNTKCLVPGTTNSSGTKRSKAKRPPLDHGIKANHVHAKNQKHPKKHKARSKSGDLCGNEAISAQDPPTRQVIKQTRAIKDSIGDSNKGKVPKRKRRKSNVKSSTVMDGGGVKASPPHLISKSTCETRTITNKGISKRSNEKTVISKHSKKKRCKKTPSKLEELPSSSNAKEDTTSATSIDSAEVLTARMPDITQEDTQKDKNDNNSLNSEMREALQSEHGDSSDITTDREFSISVKVQDKDDSDNVSLQSSKISLDGSSTAVACDGEITNPKDTEDENAKESVSVEEDTSRNRNDLTESTGKISDHTNIDDESKETLDEIVEDASQNGEHLLFEEKSPQIDAEEVHNGNIDELNKETATHEGKSEGIAKKEFLQGDSEMIDEESIVEKNTIDQKGDFIATSTEEIAENEEASRADEDKVTVESRIEEINIQENEALMGEETKSKFAEKGTSQVNMVDSDNKNCDEKVEDLKGEDEDQAEIIEEECMKIEVEIADRVESSNEVGGEESSEVDCDEKVEGLKGQGEDRAKIIEEESMEMKVEIADQVERSNEVYGEESSEVGSSVLEDELTKKENNGDAEVHDKPVHDTPDTLKTSKLSSDELCETENETHRGVSVDDDSDQETTSSEDSGIDPEQDVVSFIEEVLDENVRSWIEESDSHFENIVKKNRGGHVDSVAGKTSGSIMMQDGREIEEVSEKSDVGDDDCKAGTQDSKGSIEESKGKFGIVDRKSLQKLNDKASDAVVSVVTWNLAEDSPSEEDAAFIRKFRKNGISPEEGSDLVLISGQECENIKPRRSEGRRSREYRRLMIKMLGKDYVPVALHLLGGIQFGLFAKRSFLKEIEDVSVTDVTCGIGNVLHNKGAIAAFVKVKARNHSENNDDKKRSKSLRMVFVAAHLAAHVKNTEARDSDFWRISSELEAQAPEGFLPRKLSNRESSGSFLFDSVDRVFFCGDLNYRLDLPREMTEHAILHGINHGKASIDNLLRHDQLIQSMSEGRAFPGFGEGKITFLPTFKYDKESSSYDTSHKQRIPAWTDRILFQPASDIRVLDYQSVPGAQSSDHRPVYGTYRIGMEGREVSQAFRKRKRKRID